MSPSITLYTMGHCPYCKKAKALLRDKGITEWVEYDLEVIPEKRAEMIQRSGGGDTVPQIFIDGHHVGGASDLFALDAAGGLDRLLGLSNVR